MTNMIASNIQKFVSMCVQVCGDGTIGKGFNATLYRTGPHRCYHDIQDQGSKMSTRTSQDLRSAHFHMDTTLSEHFKNKNVSASVNCTKVEHFLCTNQIL